MKNRILNNCQKKQMVLLKSLSKSYRSSDNLQSVICNYDTIPNNNCNYDIISIIYEHCQKAAYIIKTKNENITYFMKVKSKDLDNYNEIAIFNHMIDLHHPNIIQFVEYYDTPQCYNFVYEYVEGISLSNYVGRRTLDDGMIRGLFSQIVSAVKFLHDNMIIHCDLKMDNVIVLRNGTVKLIDFDLARLCIGPMECITDVVIGTDGYISPESYDLCIYSPKSDVWAIGVMLHIVITGKFPFDPMQDDSNMYRRNKFKHLDIYDVKREVKHKHYSIDYVKLIKKMLKFNDEDRIGIDEINLKLNQ